MVSVVYATPSSDQSRWWRLGAEGRASGYGGGSENEENQMNVIFEADSWVKFCFSEAKR
jgi:hypothetical protein